MIGRMAMYRASGDPMALARQAEEGILPQFREQQGFKAYTVAIDGDVVISYSAWDTRADAEAGSQIAAEFVRNEMAGQLELLETRLGEIAFSTPLGVSTLATANA